jgi:hypothetical protein
MLNAMLVCDAAIKEAGTGKISLIGIFENLNTVNFPARHPQLAVYVKLTDAAGQYQLRLELVQLENATIIGQGEGAVTVHDRMESAELVFELHNLTFNAPGLYSFNLSANGRLVGSKTFSVLQLKRPGGG